MKKRLIKIVIIFVSLILIMFIAFTIYTSNYYEAVDVDSYLNDDTDSVDVSYDDSDNIWFVPSDSDSIEESAFVFYPGGLVEASAYAPIMYELAEDGYISVIVDMPYKLAMFNSNGATDVINNSTYTNLNWYIGGHSLGGVFAARYYLKNPTMVNGLVLLASYSDKDLSSINPKVLTIYGSNDGVLDMDSYNDNYSNLSTNVTQYIIDGGNHSYFGSYGLQKNDNEATITQSEQWSITTSYIEEFIN